MCGGSNPLSSQKRFPWLWRGCSCHSPFLRDKSRGSSGHSVLALRKDFAIGLVQSEGVFSPGIVPRRFVVCTMYAHLHFWPSTHQTKIFVKHVPPTSYDEFSKKSATSCLKISRKWKGLLETVPFFGTLGSDDMGDTVRSCMVWNYMEIWLVQVTKCCSFHTRKLSKPCMMNTLLNSTTAKDIQ